MTARCTAGAAGAGPLAARRIGGPMGVAGRGLSAVGGLGGAAVARPGLGVSPRTGMAGGASDLGGAAGTTARCTGVVVSGVAWPAGAGADGVAGWPAAGRWAGAGVPGVLVVLRTGMEEGALGSAVAARCTGGAGAGTGFFGSGCAGVVARCTAGGAPGAGEGDGSGERVALRPPFPEVSASLDRGRPLSLCGTSADNGGVWRGGAAGLLDGVRGGVAARCTAGAALGSDGLFAEPTAGLTARCTAGAEAADPGLFAEPSAGLTVVAGLTTCFVGGVDPAGAGPATPGAVPGPLAGATARRTGPGVDAEADGCTGVGADAEAAR
ncbi:hypothetical protein GCM10010388_02570 [Streptomyces mauvecolor]